MRKLGEFDKELRAENFIPVTSWLSGYSNYMFIEREGLRLKKEGFDIRIKTHMYKRCLYRKLSGAEINNIAIHGTLFDMAKCRISNIAVRNKGLRYEIKEEKATCV